GLTGDCVCCVDHLGLRGWGLVERALFVSARRTTLRVRSSAYCVIGRRAYHMLPPGGRRSGRVTVLALPHPHEYRNINASVIVGKHLSPDSYLPGPSFEPYGKTVGRSGRGRPTAGAGHRARTPAASSWAKERTAVRAVSRSGASSTR